MANLRLLPRERGLFFFFFERRLIFARLLERGSDFHSRASSTGEIFIFYFYFSPVFFIRALAGEGL